jgi:hypothetical protein
MIDGLHRVRHIAELAMSIASVSLALAVSVPYLAIVATGTGPSARCRRRHSDPVLGRNAQNTGHSPREKRTGQIDPELPFPLGIRYGRDAHMGGPSRQGTGEHCGLATSQDRPLPIVFCSPQRRVLSGAGPFPYHPKAPDAVEA